MAVVLGKRTQFIAPWLITLAPGWEPLHFAHEVAHALLYKMGFCRDWARANKLTEVEYEALTWAVCAKFVKDEYWDIEVVQKFVNSHSKLPIGETDDACSEST